MNYKHLLPALLLAPSLAVAKPAPAPDAMFLMSADTFATGQSNNLGPALNHTIDEFWTKGACSQTDIATTPTIIETNWATCDALRFGAALYSNKLCNDTYLEQMPAEDGGGPLGTWIRNVHNSNTFCTNPEFVPTDDALEDVRNLFFPTAVPTQAVLEAWYGRPHVVLTVVGEVPQTSNTVPGGRLLNSLKQACLNLQGGPLGLLPSIPTWVLLARTSEDPAHPYGQLLAGAGGTAECLYDPPNDGDTVKTPINVCDHVFDGRTEATIRKELLQEGRYDCSAGATLAMTGLMDYGVDGYCGDGKCIGGQCQPPCTQNSDCENGRQCGANGFCELKACANNMVCLPGEQCQLTPLDAVQKYCVSNQNDCGGGKGTLPAIECMLIGEQFGNQCNNGAVPYDILGILTCVRQLPWTCDENGMNCGVAPWQDVQIKYCPDGEANPSTCIYLTEYDPANCDPDDDDDPGCNQENTYTWLDERKTIFAINDREICDIGGDTLIIDVCPKTKAGEICQIDGLVGRCAFAEYQCINNRDVCVGIFGPMPEICNGLDDDCDGRADNMSTSWDNFNLTLPNEYAGLDCGLADVCRCPDGNSDTHAGLDYSSYLANWDPICECGEGLAPASSTPVASSPAQTEPAAGCSATGGAGFSALLILGLVGLIRRRR